MATVLTPAVPAELGEVVTVEQALAMLRTWSDERALVNVAYHLTPGVGVSLCVPVIGFDETGDAATVRFVTATGEAAVFLNLTAEARCWLRRLSNGEQGQYETRLMFAVDNGLGWIRVSRFRPLEGVAGETVN